jgi:hypothetical protein
MVANRISSATDKVFAETLSVEGLAPFDDQTTIAVRMTLFLFGGFGSLISKLRKFCRHCRIRSCELLDCHILRLVVREAQIAVCTYQGVPWRWSIDLSISLIAVWKCLDAKS